MDYRVIFAPSFRDDVRAHVRYLRDERVGDVTIERWFDGLLKRSMALSSCRVVARSIDS